MRNPLRRAAVCFGLLLTVALCFPGSNHSFGQRRASALVCKQQVLAALKPIPKLDYECGDLPNDWEEKILEFHARRDAIKNLTLQLATFTDAAWRTLDGGAEPLQIIRRNTLAPTFIIYRDNGRAWGSKPSRKVLHWNGNVYR